MEQRGGTDAERRLARARLEVRHARERLGEGGYGTWLRRRLELMEGLDRLSELLSGPANLPDRFDELEVVLAERVGLGREVVRDEDCRPWLAQALVEQARLLGVRRRRAEAVGPAREGVALFRALAAEEPDEYRRLLAAALENLANQLSPPATRAEALATVREALELRRVEDRVRPGPVSGNGLASALTDLGMLLDEAGAFTEAVPVLREAVLRYRTLDATRQADGEAYWAALSTYAQALRHAGAGEGVEAHVCRELMAAVHRRLAEQSPEGLAVVNALLADQGYTTDEDGGLRDLRPDRRAEDASQAPLQAPPQDAPQAPPQDTSRDASQAPWARIEELAVRAREQTAQRDFAGALATHREAVSYCRGLPQADPRAVLGLAGTLHDLGLLLGTIGRPAEAVPPLTEAVGLHRRLLPAAPGPIRPLLAGSLDTLGSRLASCGRHRDALAATAEAVELMRLVVDAPPGAHGPADARPGGEPDAAEATRELARMLNNLSIRHADLERHEDARTASREAVARYRGTSLPEDELSGLVHALANLALREARLEHTAPVPALLQEVLALLDRPVRFPPGVRLDGLADSLHWLAWYLKRHQHHREGRAAERAASALRRWR
ncbi:tetratricopeptide repeat protein [Kitasatospora sp. NPDC058162]|uniref:tetratricopeptide repeat protein n=1 Tax=Kitasatospora sp. NPDC058162 TaxID=3346362 RepID=UPI0036D88E51